MARTFTAVYNPYSFDELVKPLAMYASEYRRLEDLMNKAYEEGVIEGTIAEGTKAYQMWEGINNNLREVADELATNGMNPLLNKRINSVARDYRMKSKTLTQANAAYQQERLRRLNAMDSHVFLNNSSLSIDDFLDGKTPESKSVDLLDLTKEVGTEAAQLASALYSSPDWNNIKTRLGGLVYSIVTPNGAPVDLIEASMYDDDAYNFVIANSTDKKFRENLSKFRYIYRNAMNRIDYTKYDSLDLLRLDEAIRLGMRAGMELPKTETVANRNYRTTEQIIKNNLDKAAFNFQWDYTGEYGSNNMKITGESQTYRDLQTVKSAQSQGYEPEFNPDGSYKKDENGNIVFKLAFKKSSGGSGQSGEDWGVEGLKLKLNEDGSFVATISNTLKFEDIPTIEYKDIPLAIKDELDINYNINAGNANTYNFGKDKDGNYYAKKQKKYTTKISSNPLDFTLVTPPQVQDNTYILLYPSLLVESNSEELGSEGDNKKEPFVES